MVQLYLGIAIAVLLGLYFFLKKRWEIPSLPVSSQTTPPTISEDVNLPSVQKSPSDNPKS